MWTKNTVENLDLNFLKTADEPFYVKIVLIVHNKCSQADIAHNYVSRSKVEQRTRTNLAHPKQTDGCLFWVGQPSVCFNALICSSTFARYGSD